MPVHCNVTYALHQTFTIYEGEERPFSASELNYFIFNL
jgi:hypothetical protein